MLCTDLNESNYGFHGIIKNVHLRMVKQINMNQNVSCLVLLHQQEYFLPKQAIVIELKNGITIKFCVFSLGNLISPSTLYTEYIMFEKLICSYFTKNWAARPQSKIIIEHKPWQQVSVRWVRSTNCILHFSYAASPPF